MSTRLAQILINSLPKILLPGLLYTIPLTLSSFALGFIIAILVAIIRVANVKVLSQICWFYVWVFRGTPLLVQLFIIFYGLPGIGVNIEAVPAAIIAFSLNVGAYNRLGTMASHGCVRMTAGDCKWIYDNCKVGTKVEIYNSKKNPGPFDKPKAKKLSASQTWDPTDPAFNN